MGCLVTAAFSFAKTAGNKEKIVALVLKLETAVKVSTICYISVFILFLC
jgi:hypothetical protein